MEETITYNEYINSIISSRGAFGVIEGYKETHHIIPKCLGGTDNKENLVELYAKEHFIAHKLLAKENPDNDKLGLAYAMMAFCTNNLQERYELSPEEYEECRIIFSNARKGHFVSEDTKNKISKKHKGTKWFNNGIVNVKGTICPEGFIEGRLALPNEVYIRISQSKEGFRWYTNGIENVQCKECPEGFWLGRTINTNGENNGFYGKKHSDEARQKMSQIKKKQHIIPKTAFKKGHIPWSKGKTGLVKCSEETKVKLSKVTKNTVWYNNGLINKRLSEGEEIPEGFTKGRLPFKYKNTIRGVNNGTNC